MSITEFLGKHHLQNRKLLKKLLSSVNEDQANEIPRGFNNNIIWNFAHVISIQQGLVYQLCEKKPKVDKSIIRQFTIGTKPSEPMDSSFIENISELLITTSLQMAEDLKNEEFILVQPFITAIKTELSNIDEVLAFNNYHEGLHLGVITSLLKNVEK